MHTKRQHHARAGLFASAMLLAITSAGAIAGPITADEKSPTFDNVETQIRALKPTAADAKIKGTYSTKYLINVYSAGVEHVQGIAQLPDTRLVLSHESRSDRRGFMVVQDGSGDTVFVDLPLGDHPGAIQAAGKVVAVPSKGRGTYLLDARNAAAPTFEGLKHMYLPTTGEINAAGIAYVPSEDRHFLVTTSTPEWGSGNTSLYRSTKGMSLFDVRNRWEYVMFFTEKQMIASQGGTQLLVDKTGGVFVAAFYRDDGVETIALTRINNIGTSPTTTKLDPATSLSAADSSDSYGAGFRWGGTAALLYNPLAPRTPPKLVAVGVARTLTNGPAEQFARIKVWGP